MRRDSSCAECPSNANRPRKRFPLFAVFAQATRLRFLDQVGNRAFDVRALDGLAAKYRQTNRIHPPKQNTTTNEHVAQVLGYLNRPGSRLAC
jgi:hypothetical protein